METQLPENYVFVASIIRESKTEGFYEGFLESAPQLIFQLYIIVRSGFISECDFLNLFSAIFTMWN